MKCFPFSQAKSFDSHCTILMWYSLQANDHRQHLIGPKINRKTVKWENTHEIPCIHLTCVCLYLCVAKYWMPTTTTRKVIFACYFCGKRWFHRSLCSALLRYPLCFMQCDLFVSHLWFAPQKKLVWFIGFLCWAKIFNCISESLPFFSFSIESNEKEIE